MKLILFLEIIYEAPRSWGTCGCDVFDPGSGSCVTVMT